MAENKITDQFINQVVDKISREKNIRRKLPGGGKINVERSLPYLVVYRFANKKISLDAAKLVTSEASYIIIPDEEKYFIEFQKLIHAIAEFHIHKHSSFLLLEVWPSRHANDGEFVIYKPKQGADSTVKVLQRELKQLREHTDDLEIVIKKGRDRQPQGLKPFISAEESKDLGCLTLGVQIPAIYVTKDGVPYPVFYRDFRKTLSDILRHGIYDFLRVQTTSDIGSMYRLGRRQVDTAVWHIDKKLAQIEKSYDFLLLVSPMNIEEAWQEFERNHCDTLPEFNYRLLPLDPDVFKRKLYNLNMNYIDDPALAYLFRDKRKELDIQLSMLAERNTPHFKYNSIRLYRGVTERIHKRARKLLSSVNSSSGKASTQQPQQEGVVGAERFKERAEEEFKYYKRKWNGFNATARIRKDVTGLMVSKGQLFIPANLSISPDRLDALIHHEVGTHVLTYYNGYAQPLQQLHCGLADYDELQEGIAVLSEFLVGGLSESRMRLLAARVIAAHILIDGGDFLECYRVLADKYGFNPKTAFGITVRIYSCGGFIKDVIYLRGIIRVLRHLENGGKFKPLFVGKIAEKHIPVIEELMERGILSEIPLMPHYLESEDAIKRLEKVREGISLTNLID